jgi:hypothetical protein
VIYGKQVSSYVGQWALLSTNAQLKRFDVETTFERSTRYSFPNTSSVYSPARRKNPPSSSEPAGSRPVPNAAIAKAKPLRDPRSRHTVLLRATSFGEANYRAKGGIKQSRE